MYHITLPYQIHGHPSSDPTGTMRMTKTYLKKLVHSSWSNVCFCCHRGRL
jgi:hypothetical protein